MREGRKRGKKKEENLRLVTYGKNGGKNKTNRSEDGGSRDGDVRSPYKM